MSTTYDMAARAVSALLPGTDVEADMGGDGVLQVCFPSAGADPETRAGIDDASGGRWWLDIAGGQRTEVSALTVDSDSFDVADWIRTNL